MLPLASVVATLILVAVPASAATCIGTNGDDTLSCSSGDDFIDGLNGDDQLHGLGGHDEIWGRSGFDVLQGDAGADELFGAGGNDLSLGDSGNDELDDSSVGADGDHLCGLTGSNDVIRMDDGDGSDVGWDFDGASVFRDISDMMHTTGSFECP